MRVPAFARFLCAALLILVIFTPPANAQNAAQKRLRQALSTFLSEQKALIEAGGDVRLKREGEITIEPQDDYYVVTMPHLMMVHDSGRRVDFGILSINARPAKGEKMWNISMALPTPILVYNKKDLLTARLDLGDQTFTGTWHAGYQSFKDVQARYKDVVLKDHKGGGTFQIPEIRIDQKMTSDGAPVEWTGASRLTFKDTSVLTDKGQELVTIGEAGLNLKFDSYSPKRQQDFRSEWVKLIEDTQNKAQYTNKALALYDLVTKKLLQIQNDADVTTFAEDIHIKPTRKIREQNEKTDIRSIKLSRLQYKFGFSDIRSDNKAGLNFGFALKGMTIEPRPDIAKGLTPKDMRMHYKLTNLPYQKLIGFGRKQLAARMSGKAGAQSKSKKQAMQAIPQMLTEAGTQFKMTNNYIRAGDYQANIDATLKADAGAAMNFTLDAQARINGLQGLINTLKTRAKNAENPMIAGNLKKAVGMLTTVHMLGQQGEKGKDSRVYNIMVNKAGEAMLNGSNLSNLMQAFQSDGNSNGDQGNTAIPKDMAQ